MKKKLALLALLGGAAYWWFFMKITYPKINATSSNSYDAEILARTLWGEARGEGRDGMEAIASVVINRVADRRWPDSVAAVCLQPWQFSCWNENDPNRARLLSVTSSDLQFRQALEIAKKAISGTLADVTGGANHYFADYIKAPSWASDMSQTAALGRHKFFAG